MSNGFLPKAGSRLNRVPALPRPNADEPGHDDMTCTHEHRREIAEPQKNIRDGVLLDERRWFCNDCGEKWDTSERLGDVDTIELNIELARHGFDQRYAKQPNNTR